MRDKEEIDFEFFFTDSFKRSDLVVVCHSACDAGTGNFVVVSDEMNWFQNSPLDVSFMVAYLLLWVLLMIL